MKRRNSEAQRGSLLARRNSELKRGSSFHRAQKKAVDSPKTQLPPTLEPVCEYSIDEVSNNEQRKRLAEYSESSSDSAEDTMTQDEGAVTQETRRTRQLQKRASGLSVVSRTKVLRGVPTRLQVLFARQLRRLDYSAEGEEDVLARAGDKSPEYSRFMVLDDGFVDVIATCPNGKEVVITRIGPGSIIGGMQSLGLTKTHLFTIRRSYMKSKSRTCSSGLLDTSKPHLETDEVDKDETKEIATPIELITYFIPASDMAQLQDHFREELAILKSRVLSDLHRFVVPHLERLASAGFFRRYCSAFVKRVVKNMDMRICQPGELIFKESSKAQSMAILFCGWIDIYVDGKFVSTQGEPGLCFGEAALLEDHALRTATVRSNEKSDCVVCLLQKDDFHAALNEFPDEKKRLDEQVKSKLTRLSMQAVFTGCNHDFLHFLSAIAESVELEEGQSLYDTGTEMEELLMLQRGEAVMQKVGEADELLQKGAFVGIRAAIGLHRGPSDYVIRAEARGCSLVRITHEMLERAFCYFPDQIGAVLKDIGLDRLPDDHSFNHKGIEIWSIIQPLLCQAFMTMDFDVEICKALAPFFKVEICDPGCTITEEGKDAHEMVLLLHGTVGWHTAGKVSTVATGPRYFDEGLIIGTQRRQTATITAKSICVLWLLSNSKLQAMRRCHPSVCKIFDDAATLRRSLLLNLQARLRNMKTFRRFRSEILELISRSVDIRTFLPGDVIFGMGDMADCLYILLQGKAEAIVSGRTGLLEEGSTFGEMALFGQVKRNMTVKASTLCVCNVVHRDIITYAFKQFPEDQHLQGSQAEPRNRGVFASVVAPRVKPSEEKIVSKPRYKRASNFASQISDKSAASIAAFPGKNSNSRPNSAGLAVAGRDKRAFTMVEEKKHSNKGVFRRSKSWHAKRHETTEDDDDSDGLLTSSEASTSKDEDENGDISDLDVTETLALPEKMKITTLSSSGNSLPVENSFNLVEGNSRPPSIVPSDRDDIEFGSTSSGLNELHARPHRSCLFNMSAPKLPPTEYQLYRPPKVAEERLSAAFRNLMPRGAAATSARVHGLPSAARSRQQLDSLSMEMSRETFVSASGNFRQKRVWPTYTSPLPPVQHIVRPHTNAGVPVGAYPKDTERTVAIAAQLQLLSSSLLRISSKPSLQHLCQEPHQEARHIGEEDASDDISAVSSKPSSARGVRKAKRPKGGTATLRNVGARCVYEPQPPKRPREKQRPQRLGGFTYQAFSPAEVEAIAAIDQSRMPSGKPSISTNSASVEDGILPAVEQDLDHRSPASVDTGTERRDSLMDSKELSSLGGSFSSAKRRTEWLGGVVGCEGQDAGQQRNIFAPVVQTNSKPRQTLAATNSLLKELLVRRVQEVADDDTVAELEKFGEEGNFDDAYEMLRSHEDSKLLMKRASIQGGPYRSSTSVSPSKRRSSRGLGRSSIARDINYLIRCHIIRQCCRRAQLEAERKDSLDAAIFCRRSCYAAAPQYQASLSAASTNFEQGGSALRAVEDSPLKSEEEEDKDEESVVQRDAVNQSWKSGEEQDAAALVAAVVSFVAVTVCRASMKVSLLPQTEQSKERVDWRLDSLVSWPSSSNELVVPMAAGGCEDRPTSRKKAPSQEAMESLLPILEPDQPPPQPRPSRNSLKGNRRVRVSLPAEERAASISMAFCICQMSYAGAARLHLAKAERADVRMAGLLVRKSLMASIANHSASPSVQEQSSAIREETRLDLFIDEDLLRKTLMELKQLAKVEGASQEDVDSFDANEDPKKAAIQWIQNKKADSLLVVGASVEYLCKTKGMWLPAVVEERGHGFCKLNIKSHAEVSRIRKAGALGLYRTTINYENRDTWKEHMQRWWMSLMESFGVKDDKDFKLKYPSSEIDQRTYDKNGKELQLDDMDNVSEERFPVAFEIRLPNFSKAKEEAEAERQAEAEELAKEKAREEKVKAQILQKEAVPEKTQGDLGTKAKNIEEDLASKMPQEEPPPNNAESSAVEAKEELQIGDQVEIYSHSKREWCRGVITKVRPERPEAMVTVEYSNGRDAMSKDIATRHPHLQIAGSHNQQDNGETNEEFDSDEVLFPSVRLGESEFNHM